MSANRLKLNADKTELLWVASRHCLSQQGRCLPVVKLGSNSIESRDQIHLLGVALSSDLSQIDMSIVKQTVLVNCNHCNNNISLKCTMDKILYVVIVFSVSIIIMLCCIRLQ